MSICIQVKKGKRIRKVLRCKEFETCDKINHIGNNCSDKEFEEISKSEVDHKKKVKIEEPVFL